MKGVEDWAGALMASIFTGLMAGIGGAMAWFKGSKAKIHLRIDEVEGKVDAFQEQKATHDVRLERVETCQENTSVSLTDLKEGQKALHEKMDNLSSDIIKAITGRA